MGGSDYVAAMDPNADAFQAAIDAYLDGHDAPPEVLARGALLSFSGIAGNGGLMGALDTLRATDGQQVMADAVAAMRAHDLNDLAELTERADTEFRRMRPHEDAELSEADEALWEELDEAWFALDPDGRIEQAVARGDGATA